MPCHGVRATTRTKSRSTCFTHAIKCRPGEAAKSTRYHRPFPRGLQERDLSISTPVSPNYVLERMGEPFERLV
jgi:hypothetical protein